MLTPRPAAWRYLKLRRLTDFVRLRAAHRRHAVRAERLILIHSGRPHAISRYGPCVPTSHFARSCALCDVIWTGLTEKSEWNRLRKDLAIPLEHTFENSAAVGALALCRGLPSIVVVTFRSHELLLDAEALRACAGDVPTLRDQIRRSTRVRGLDAF